MSVEFADRMPVIPKPATTDCAIVFGSTSARTTIEPINDEKTISSKIVNAFARSETSMLIAENKEKGL
ncbi:MAG: hypothetical protein ACRCXB_00325, partial [Aeromonadaceae bacterium]